MSFLQGNTSKSGLLDDILSKCEDNTGKYEIRVHMVLVLCFLYQKKKKAQLR